MKHYFKIAVLFLICCMFFGWNTVDGQEKKNRGWDYFYNHTDWEAFSKNLVKALKSDNRGLKISAMQHVITYKDKLNVNEAVLDIIALYHNDKDVRVRQMALATLHAMKNNFAKAIIKRDLQFENSPKVKRMMIAIVYEKTRKAYAVKDDDEKIVSSLPKSENK